MKFLSELSKETLICSELQVKDYKELLKCSFGDEPNKIIFVETVCDVLSNITNKTPEYFKKLSIIDLFVLLLDVRINSQGDVCKVVITKEDKQMNLELRLDCIRDDIKTIFTTVSEARIVQNDIEIVFDCPSIERLANHTDDEYLYFIKGLFAKSTKKVIVIQSNEDARLLFEKLPPKASLQIIDQFQSFVKQITDINFLSRYGIKDQKLAFVPSLESLIWFAKLMFNETLDVFYDNLFYLSHLGHMSAEYVEGSVVGEYNYFVSCLQRTLAAKNPSPGPDDQMVSDEEAGFFDEQV